MQIPQRLFYDLGKSEVLGASLAGLLTVPLAALAAPVPVALSTGYLVASMILIIVVDLRHFIIPDGLSLPAIAPDDVIVLASASGRLRDASKAASNRRFSVPRRRRPSASPQTECSC